MTRDEFFDDVINKLKIMIRQQGFRNVDIAHKLNMTQQSISLTLNRHHNPTLGRLYDFADAANLDIEINFKPKEGIQ